MANLVLRTTKQSPLTIEELDQNFVNLNEQFSELDASNLIQGTVPLDRLGLGSPDESKFLRGDNTWGAVPIIPSQLENALSFLQTDGESLIWTPIIQSPILIGSEYKSVIGGTDNLVSRVLGDNAPNGDIYTTNRTMTDLISYDTLYADESQLPVPSILSGQINPILEIGSILFGSGIDADGGIVVGTVPNIYTYDRISDPSTTLNDYAVGLQQTQVWPKNTDPNFNAEIPHVSVNVRQVRIVAQEGSTNINAALAEGGGSSPTVFGVYGIYPEIGDKITCDAFPNGAIVVHSVYGSPDIIVVDTPAEQSGIFYATVSSPHASVLSGSKNFAVGNTALVVNGDNNFALGAKTTVLNGNYNVVNTPYSTIINGKFNAISQSASTIISGSKNTIFSKSPPSSVNGIDPALGGFDGGTYRFGFIAAGNDNTISGNSLILKGNSNQISIIGSGTVLDGSNNQIRTEGGTTILQGSSNNIGNDADTTSVTIVSGNNNSINSDLPLPPYSATNKSINGNDNTTITNKVISGDLNSISGGHNTVVHGGENTITGHYVDVIYGYNNVIQPIDRTARPVVNGSYRSLITDGISLHGWNMVSNTTNQRVEGIIPQSSDGWEPLSVAGTLYFGDEWSVPGGTQKSTYLQSALTLTGKQTRKLSGYISADNVNDTDATLKRGFIKIRAKTSYFITGKVIARRSVDGKTKAWDVKALVTRDAGSETTRIVGTPTYNVYAQDSGTENWAITGAVTTISGEPVFTIQADRSSTASDTTEKWLMALDALEVRLEY